MGRPWTQIEGLIQEALMNMASNALGDVSTTGAPTPTNSNYSVNSKVYSSLNQEIGSGSYTSSNNRHAEIAAIAAINGGIPNGCTIKTDKEPCYRCAAVLRVFQKDYQWTVVAPKNDAFAPTYSGGYDVPDVVLDAVIARLVTLSKITAQEGQTHRQSIKSFIACGDYKPK